MGSGKSTIMGKIMEKETHVVYISTRKCFTNNLIQRFPYLQSYEHIKTHQINLAETPKIVIQIDALNRLKNIQHRNDILYIFDEYESCLTQIKEKKDVYETLVNILKSKSRLFVLDAFLNDTSLQLITQYRQIDKRIVNTYQPYKKNQV
jgi:adenylate kinase family enzyme